ncbi:MAG: HAD family hydrolase [Bacilli bacterium]
MKNTKLFVIDLDGTALLNFVTLHPKTIEGVKHVTSLGHKVVIATGRAECACINFYNELNMDTFLITSNGSILNNPSNRNYIGWSRCVKKELIEYILSPTIHDNIENIYYYANNQIYVHKYHELVIEKLMMTGCGVDVKELNNDINVNSIALIVRNNMVEKVRKDIKNKFPEQDFNSWDGNYHESYIEVNPDNTNKWHAVCEVAKLYGIKNEDIYTFGDANNDYEMIKECNNGVVMKNATHKLKSVGNIILNKTNEEGAVGEFLLTFD